jgi:hypothetical protein
MASSDHQQDPHTFSASQVPLPHDAADDDGAEALSPLEQEVLDEYARLLGNLNNVRRPFCAPFALAEVWGVRRMQCRVGAPLC